MKKRKGSKRIVLCSLIVFALAFIIIVLTIPDGFEHYGDMGTSATGVALSRSYYDQSLNQFTDSPGYLVNGRYETYSNWPAFGFKVLAGWYQLLGGDSIYNARLLPSLLYALSALMFFLLLLRSDIDVDVSFISALLFSVLPYHLEFGKLIFSDMWLVPFWLLCLLIFTGHQRYHWLIILVALVGATGFMWFVIFVISAFALLTFLRFSQFRPIQVIFFLFTFLIVTWVFQGALFAIFEDVQILSHLQKWTVFGHFSIDKILKRPMTLIYESLSVIALFFFLAWKAGFKFPLKKIKDRVLFNVLLLTILTLFGYVIFLPKWVVLHGYGVGFFSIFIAGSGALLLQMAKDSYQMNALLVGVIMIICSTCLYFIYPMLAKGYNPNVLKAKRIAQYINSHHSGSGSPTIFFDISSKEINWHHAFRFGIKEETRSYIFISTEMGDIERLSDKIDQGFHNLRQLGKQDFDSDQTYFVTDQVVPLPSLMVLDSIDLGNVYFYKLGL